MSMTFHNPTQAEREVADHLEEVGMLDTKDARAMVLGRKDEIAAAIAAGRTPVDIAIDMHLLSVIGVSELDLAAARAQPGFSKEWARSVSAWTLDDDFAKIGAAIDHNSWVVVAVPNRGHDGYELYYTRTDPVKGPMWGCTDYHFVPERMARKEAEQMLAQLAATSSVTAKNTLVLQRYA